MTKPLSRWFALTPTIYSTIKAQWNKGYYYEWLKVFSSPSLEVSWVLYRHHAPKQFLELSLKTYRVLRKGKWNRTQLSTPLWEMIHHGATPLKNIILVVQICLIVPCILIYSVLSYNGVLWAIHETQVILIQRVSERFKRPKTWGQEKP